MLHRDVTCDGCGGWGDIDMAYFGLEGMDRCIDCDGTGIRREVRLDGLVAILLAIALVAGFVADYWLRGDVEAYAERMVAVEGEPLAPEPCGDVWVVTPGDTLWGIASHCYPGEHTGARAHEILALNGVDAGRLRVGQRLVLPERGR